MNILITSIGRRDYLADYFRQTGKITNIIGTSNTKWTPGFSACDRSYLVPDIIDESKYIEAIKDICSREDIKLMFSLYDFDIQILSKHLSEFREMGVIPLIVDNALSSKCFDKFQTQELLMDLGVPYPKTYIQLADALEALDNGSIYFPLFIKPRSGFASRNIFKANTKEQLKSFFNIEPDMMIQESLSGDEYSFDLLNNLDGKNIMVVVKKKLTMRAGETDQAITIKRDDLLKFGRDLANKLAHVGPMDVDFFLHDNKPVVLELNPRFGGGYPLSHLAGADFPASIAKLMAGEEIHKEDLDYRENVIMMKTYSFQDTLAENITSLKDD